MEIGSSWWHISLSHPADLHLQSKATSPMGYPMNRGEQVAAKISMQSSKPIPCKLTSQKQIFLCKLVFLAGFHVNVDPMLIMFIGACPILGLVGLQTTFGGANPPPKKQTNINRLVDENMGSTCIWQSHKKTDTLLQLVFFGWIPWKSMEDLQETWLLLPPRRVAP